jgi:hypothetical protein
MPMLYSAVRSMVSMVRSSGIRKDYVIDEHGEHLLRWPVFCVAFRWVVTH